jgi:hypothetical protein
VTGLAGRGGRSHAGTSPGLAGAAQLLGGALVVFELGVEERGEGTDTLGLGLLDVLHTSEDVLARLFKLGLVHANLFLDTEVVATGLLQLGGRGVVSETTVLELLAGGLVGIC